jgi:hypothetical protein
VSYKYNIRIKKAEFGPELKKWFKEKVTVRRPKASAHNTKG